MHFQFPPKAETKLVRATRGAVVDIIVDLRPESPTYLEHVSVELSEDNGRAIYVPERFGHGYQTLVDDTETSYQVGEFYAPETEGGLRYDDPRLGLPWPLPVTTMSEKDQGWTPLDEYEPELAQKDGTVILVDNALRERETEGRPVRVGMLGAGFMGQGLTNQIENSVPGMRMAAIYNRTPQRAVDVYAYSGHEGVRSTASQREFDDLNERGIPVVAEDPYLLCRSPHVDILVDVTGSVEFGAHVILEAFRHGKSVVLMNAEVDATIGPILRVHAKRHGQILSACDGDEPGLQMNLVRWVTGLGLTPRVVCNIKGLQDPYRNPTTQQAWAERWEQNPAMVTSFADGSKISFEQAIVANATGFSVLKRGMSRGQVFDGSVMDTPSLYDVDELRRIGGAINYTVGPALVKAYVLAEHPDPKQRHYLELYKMGPGPLYPFWVPYHLVHFETPFSIARVALFGDDLAPSLGGPVVEVAAVAKRDLKAGEDARRLRHVHDLRRGHQRRRDERGALPARGAGRGMPSGARRGPGPGAHLRRRRAAAGTPGRPAAGGAVPALPRRNVVGAAADSGASSSRRHSDRDFSRRANNRGHFGPSTWTRVRTSRHSFERGETVGERLRAYASAVHREHDGFV